MACVFLKITRTMKKISLIMLLAAGFLLPASCVKDEPEIESLEYTRPLNVAAPVAVISSDYYTFLKRIAHNNVDPAPQILAGDDGLLYVVYSKDYEVKWNDVLNLNDIFWNTMALIPLSEGTSIHQQMENRVLLNSDSTQRVDSAIIDQTTMTVKAQPIGISGTGTLTIPEFKRNGSVLKVEWALSEGVNTTVDLKGYEMVPTQNTDSSYVTPTLVLDGRASTTSFDTYFDFNMSMTEILPEVIFGYFGNKEVYNKNSDMGLDFFDSYDFTENIEFTGAYIGLTVDNWTGTPFDVTMDIMRFMTREADSMKINFFNMDNTLYVEEVKHEDYRSDGNFTPRHNEYVLDESTSDVNSLLRYDPISYKYNMTVVSNPHGSADSVGEPVVNFLTQETTLQYHAKVYIPLWMRITDVDHTDSIDFDINSIILDKDNADFVDTMALYFTFNNGFPITLVAQAYLVDEYGTVVDSLFEHKEEVWSMPEVDINNRVTGKIRTTSQSFMTSEKIKKCSEADVKKILLKSVVNTGTGRQNEEFYKIFKDYGMDMKFSFEVSSNLSKKK